MEDNAKGRTKHRAEWGSHRYTPIHRQDSRRKCATGLHYSGKPVFLFKPEQPNGRASAPNISPRSSTVPVCSSARMGRSSRSDPYRPRLKRWSETRNQRKVILNEV